MNPPTFATRNVWLVSYLVVAGLKLLRVVRLPGAVYRANFILADPHDEARSLMRQFLDDAQLQRLLTVRKVLGHALDLARVDEICTAEDLADELAAVHAAWAEGPGEGS